MTFNLCSVPAVLLCCAVFKQDFGIIRKSLVERGQQFLRNASLSRDKIARLGSPFVTDGAVCCLQLSIYILIWLLISGSQRLDYKQIDKYTEIKQRHERYKNAS